MKRVWLTAAAGLLSLTGAAAQERRSHDVTLPRRYFEQEFRLPDSLAARIPEWDGAGGTAGELVLPVRPAVPMSSVVVILQEYLPEETMLLNNNTLRIGRHVVLSNGQAENWAPWPAGYQDARTISLPLP